MMQTVVHRPQVECAAVASSQREGAVDDICRVPLDSVEIPGPVQKGVLTGRKGSLVLPANSIVILVIEDDPAIRWLLKTTLTVQDYRVIEAATGTGGLALYESQKPNLVTVDLGLPDIDGLEVIRRIRIESAVPLIALSARSDERSKVAALDLGADDYLTKPFGAEELVARVRTALRHRIQEQGGMPVFRSGDLSVDLVRRVVAVGGNTVRLSPKEYDVLAQLVIHAGKVLTHNHLLREVWGIPSGGDPQYLRVYVRQLRQKLETEPDHPRHILTEPGVGYRLHVDS
jgi:two-component system KDP operon response regulator KdpE